MCALGARMLLAETGQANSARVAKAWEHPKTVLCPTWVNTQLMEAERNRPAELQNDPAEEMRIKTSPEYQEVEKLVREAVQAVISCQQVADKSPQGGLAESAPADQGVAGWHKVSPLNAC